jgi:hypothetical protein
LCLNISLWYLIFYFGFTFNEVCELKFQGRSGRNLKKAQHTLSMREFLMRVINVKEVMETKCG